MTDNPNKPNHLGGTYLKPEHIKRNNDGTIRHVTCQIDDRNGGPRILPARQTEDRKFGAQLEIPVILGGTDFVIAVPSDKGDGKAIIRAFGDDFTTWAGRTLDVSEHEILENRLVVVPLG